MNVIQHGGDNYLGGSDFDRAVFDWTLSDQIDRNGGNTDQFQDGARKHQLLATPVRMRGYRLATQMLLIFILMSLICLLRSSNLSENASKTYWKTLFHVRSISLVTGCKLCRTEHQECAGLSLSVALRKPRMLDGGSKKS